MSQWVSLEGGIGGGKTTFIQKVIVPYFPQLCIVPEPVEEWEASGVLKRSYEDEQFKFAAQCVFFTSRIKKFREIYSQNKNLCPGFLSERSPFADKVFWKINCADAELHHAYMDLWNLWQDLLPLRGPSHFIFLDTPSELCITRTTERGRVAERTMTEDYQRRVVERHQKVFGKSEVKLPDGTMVPCFRVDGSLNFRDDTEVARGLAEELRVFLGLQN